jgi:hypothetical protein
MKESDSVILKRCNTRYQKKRFFRFKKINHVKEESLILAEGVYKELNKDAVSLLKVNSERLRLQIFNDAYIVYDSSLKLKDSLSSSSSSNSMKDGACFTFYKSSL